MTKHDEINEQWAEQTYLSDGEGGSLAPERNEAIDKRFEAYLHAKEVRAEATDTMAKAKEELNAIMTEQELPIYRYFHAGEYFTAELCEETKVSIVKDRPDPS